MEHLIRQSAIIPSDVLGQKINVIGAGAVGSFTALGLAKMGFLNLTVWDFDTVSVENMSNQWYRFEDIGVKKTEALKNLIKSFTGEEISTAGRYIGQKLEGVIITALDNMATRSLVYENNKDKFIIDPRMSSEYATLFTHKPDRSTYELTLFPDEKGIQEPCTAKSTMYTALMLSGFVCKTLKDYLCSTSHPKYVDWNIKENKFDCFERSDDEKDSGGTGPIGAEHSVHERVSDLQ